MHIERMNILHICPKKNGMKAECLTRLAKRVNTINPINDNGAGRLDSLYDKPPL
jgi:hypothetical protein